MSCKLKALVWYAKLPLYIVVGAVCVLIGIVVYAKYAD